MIVILLIISRFILLENLNKLERNNTRQDVERALSAYSYTLTDMESTTNDWSSWDDTYTFIEDGNDNYINSNLTDSTFTNTRINLILFINSSGRTVFGKAFDLNTNKETPVPNELQSYLSDGSLLLMSPDSESPISGLLLLSENPPLLIISRPILTSEDKGPVRGTLIMGRYFDVKEIDRLSKMTSLSLTSYRADEKDLPVDIQELYSSSTGDTAIITRQLDEQRNGGYALINDIYDRPGLIIEVDDHRDIYQQGIIAITYLIVAISIIIIAFGILAMVLADKQELNRLKKLAISVENIGTSGNLSKRVSMTGKDEISSLANNIDRMLAALQRSEDELEDKAEHLQIAIIEARAANQAKSEFLSSVSHELRTPLTAIIGLSQLLQKKYYGPLNEKQEEYVRDILESSQHLLSLINDILDLSKVEAGKLKLELSETNIKEAIDSSLLLVKEDAAKKRIGIRSTISDEVLKAKITADKRRFKQIMVNLLSNAVKFTDLNGEVDIEAKILGDELIVSVSDTGVGISKEEQGKIFDAFYQVQFKLTNKSPGTGLGLSLVKRFVEQHHGRIWVESEGPGKGSRFIFTISLRLQSQELKHDADNKRLD